MEAQADFSHFPLVFDILWVMDNTYYLYSRLYTLGNIYIEAFKVLVAVFVVPLLFLAHFRLL